MYGVRKSSECCMDESLTMVKPYRMYSKSEADEDLRTSGRRYGKSTEAGKTWRDSAVDPVRR